MDVHLYRKRVVHLHPCTIVAAVVLASNLFTNYVVSPFVAFLSLDRSFCRRHVENTNTVRSFLPLGLFDDNRRFRTLARTDPDKHTEKVGDMNDHAARGCYHTSVALRCDASHILLATCFLPRSFRRKMCEKSCWRTMPALIVCFARI